jgi:hypothetical protein
MGKILFLSITDSVHSPIYHRIPNNLLLEFDGHRVAASLLTCEDLTKSAGAWRVRGGVSGVILLGRYLLVMRITSRVFAAPPKKTSWEKTQLIVANKGLCCLFCCLRI